MYRILTEHGTHTINKTPTLRDLQNAVGGYIERLCSLPSPTRVNVYLDIYVNEEGFLNDLPVTYGYLPVTYGYGTLGGPVYGSVAISARNADGETIAATEDELRRATGVLFQW
jgi:hypothetical protein